MSDSEKQQFLEQAWEAMQSLIIFGSEEQSVRLSAEHEFRFLKTREHEYSLVLADTQVNIFHFVWKEVDGNVELTHRIVHPDFRRRGIASKLMSLLQERVQRLANEQQQPYRFGLQTSQLSVIKLCEKMGLRMTEGREHFEKLRFDVEPTTTHLVHRGFRINFSMAQIIQPEQVMIQQ